MRKHVRNAGADLTQETRFVDNSDFAARTSERDSLMKLYDTAAQQLYSLRVHWLPYSHMLGLQCLLQPAQQYRCQLPARSSAEPGGGEKLTMVILNSDMLP